VVTGDGGDGRRGLGRSGLALQAHLEQAGAQELDGVNRHATAGLGGRAATEGELPQHRLLRQTVHDPDLDPAVQGQHTDRRERLERLGDRLEGGATGRPVAQGDHDVEAQRGELGSQADGDRIIELRRHDGDPSRPVGASGGRRDESQRTHQEQRARHDHAASRGELRHGPPASSPTSERASGA
jgi:hypothetical protein